MKKETQKYCEDALLRLQKLSKRSKPDFNLLYDAALVELYDVVQCCRKSEAFFSNGAIVPVESLPSFVMDREGGLLDILLKIADATEKAGAVFPSTANQHCAMLDLVVDFFITTSDQLAIAKPFDISRLGDETARVMPGIYLRYWLTLRTALCFRMIEIKQMVQNAKAWPVLKELLSSAHTEEINMDLCSSWTKEVFEKRESIFAMLSDLNICWIHLKHVDNTLPAAFCINDESGDVRRLDAAVKTILTLRQNAHMFHPSGNWCWSPIRHLEQAIHRGEFALANILKSHAMVKDISAKTKRMWVDAMAEFMLHIFDDDDSNGNLEAEKLIYLANAAARETWIDARIRNPELPNFPNKPRISDAQQPQSVRLADDQFLHLISMSSGIANELKAHVTSEADREIAAKAPKRVRKFGHEGNGLKGPKTQKMKDQKRIFTAFLKDHPEAPGHSRISRAHECWQKHPEWIKAAQASGEAKGYANHKSLAQAK